jgi:hypothetical protein
MLQYVDIFLPLAFHCKNLPTNGLFLSTVVAAPFSDAGGHANERTEKGGPKSTPFHKHLKLSKNRLLA